MTFYTLTISFSKIKIPICLFRIRHEHSSAAYSSVKPTSNRYILLCCYHNSTYYALLYQLKTGWNPLTCSLVGQQQINFEGRWITLAEFTEKLINGNVTTQAELLSQLNSPPKSAQPQIAKKVSRKKNNLIGIPQYLCPPYLINQVSPLYLGGSKQMDPSIPQLMYAPNSGMVYNQHGPVMVPSTTWNPARLPSNQCYLIAPMQGANSGPRQQPVEQSDPPRKEPPVKLKFKFSKAMSTTMPKDVVANVGDSVNNDSSDVGASPPSSSSSEEEIQTTKPRNFKITLVMNNSEPDLSKEVPPSTFNETMAPGPDVNHLAEPINPPTTSSTTAPVVKPKSKLKTRTRTDGFRWHLFDPKQVNASAVSDSLDTREIQDNAQKKNSMPPTDDQPLRPLIASIPVAPLITAPQMTVVPQQVTDIADDFKALEKIDWEDLSTLPLTEGYWPLYATTRVSLSPLSESKRTFYQRQLKREAIVETTQMSPMDLFKRIKRTFSAMESSEGQVELGEWPANKKRKAEERSTDESSTSLLDLTMNSNETGLYRLGLVHSDQVVSKASRVPELIQAASPQKPASDETASLIIRRKEKECVDEAQQAPIDSISAFKVSSEPIIEVYSIDVEEPNEPCHPSLDVEMQQVEAKYEVQIVESSTSQQEFNLNNGELVALLTRLFGKRVMSIY